MQEGQERKVINHEEGESDGERGSRVKQREGGNALLTARDDAVPALREKGVGSSMMWGRQHGVHGRPLPRS